MVQIMNKLDRLVQLHVANIGGRMLAASPTAMQVLQFVTLVDATGRQHPIFMECCTSFQVKNPTRVLSCAREFADDVWFMQQLQAMLKVVLKNKCRDALVQKRYFDAGLYDLSIDKGTQVVQVTGEASRWPSIDAGTKLIMRVILQRKQSCKLSKCHLCGALNKIDCRNPADWSGWLTEGSMDW